MSKAIAVHGLDPEAIFQSSVQARSLFPLAQGRDHVTKQSLSSAARTGNGIERTYNACVTVWEEHDVS